MKNFRQKLQPGLTMVGLITIALIALREAAEFPQLGVVPRNGGFRMEGYWVWCGSVIKGDDGRYHMFASRWPKDITFHPGWMTNSRLFARSPIARKAHTSFSRSCCRRAGRNTGTAVPRITHRSPATRHVHPVLHGQHAPV